MNGYVSLLDLDRIPSWESEIIWDSTAKEGTEGADPGAQTADSIESSSDSSDMTSVSQRVIAPSSGAFQVDLSAPRHSACTNMYLDISRSRSGDMKSRLKAALAIKTLKLIAAREEIKVKALMKSPESPAKTLRL